MKIIKLNVGGTRYETTYDTMVVEPLSKLALLVHHKEKEDMDMEKEKEASVEALEEKMAEDGTEIQDVDQKVEVKEEEEIPDEIFIDRNGHLFEFVLEYLRNPTSVKLPHESYLILERLLVEAEHFQLQGLKQEVEFALSTYPFGVGDTIRLRPDVVGRWINNVVDKNNTTQFLYACGLEQAEPPEGSWNPFRKKSPTETFWSLFSNKRSPAEIYAWRGRIVDFVEAPNPDYAVVRFRLPQYSKKKEDPEYVDMNLRVQIGMMVKVK